MVVAAFLVACDCDHGCAICYHDGDSMSGFRHDPDVEPMIAILIITAAIILAIICAR